MTASTDTSAGVPARTSRCGSIAWVLGVRCVLLEDGARVAPCSRPAPSSRSRPSKLVRDPTLFKWYAVALLAFVDLRVRQRGRARTLGHRRRRLRGVARRLVQRDRQRARAPGHRPRAAVGDDRPDGVPVPRRAQRRDLVHVRAGRDRLREAAAGRPRGAHPRHAEPARDRARAVVVSVAVELFLHATGTFHWEYWWWNTPFVLLIVVFGYLWFYLYAAWVYDAPTPRTRWTAPRRRWRRSTSDGAGVRRRLRLAVGSRAARKERLDGERSRVLRRRRSKRRSRRCGTWSRTS